MDAPDLFPSSLDGRPLRIELAVVRACAVAYFEMQVLPDERNRINEEVSYIFVEYVRIVRLAET